MKRILDYYLKQPWDKKTLWLAAAVALLPILAALWMGHDSGAADEGHGKAHVAVDTYIPKGFVLVPIEVQNYEALDSILGQFGVVDLFQGESAGAGGSRQHLVGRNVRILRAPQNPSHFAILVQESDVDGMLKNSGPFTVVLKPPQKGGTEFVNADSQLKVKRSIVYEKD